MARRSSAVMWVGMWLLILSGAPVSGADTPNEKAVRELFAAIDAGNVERIRELVREDVALRSVDGTQSFNRDTLLQAMREFYAAFPDNKHVIGKTVAAGDLVAVMVTCHATSRGPYEGAAPTGRKVTFGGMSILRFENGRVREWWALDDNLTLMQQLGMELKPRSQK